MKRITLCLVSLLMSLSATADAWDGYDELPTQTLHDLTQGSDETHDLGARPLRIGAEADVDWFLVPQEGYSSYEVSIDGISAPAGALELTRLDATGFLIRQGSITQNTAGGWSRTLRWINTNGATTDTVRVQGADCETKCAQDARYRIRAVDTTLAISRFSNASGQVTVLHIHNVRPSSQQVNVHFWNAAGTLIGSSSSVIGAHGELALNVGSLPTMSGMSGSVSIAHDAGYGGLTADSVILEPATGFTFVYAATTKPR